MAKKKRKRLLVPRRSPEEQRAVEGLRSSNAAQPHIPEPRKGTRRAKKRDAIKDQEHDL